MKMYNYEDLFTDQEDGSTILTFPPEICEEMGLNPGDTIDMKVEDGNLLIFKDNKTLVIKNGKE